MKQNGQRRIGIIGCGNWADAHAHNYGRHDAATLHTCFDIDRDRAKAFASRHGIDHVARTVDEAIDTSDAVSVVTPDAFHAEIAIKALESGTHVLCEKPLCTSIEEARFVVRAADLAKQRGVIHMINFSKREFGAVQAALHAARSGRLGPIRHVRATYLQSYLVSSEWGLWNEPTWIWRLQQDSGGVLADLGVHMLDLVTAAAGPAQRLNCTIKSMPKELDGDEYHVWDGKPLDANDTALIHADLECGALATIDVTRWATGHLNTASLEIAGTKGAIRIDAHDHSTMYVCESDDVHPAHWTAIELAGRSAKPMKPPPTNQERFIDAIQRAQPVEPDLLRGAEIQAYIDACFASAASGTWQAPPYV